MMRRTVGTGKPTMKESLRSINDSLKGIDASLKGIHAAVSRMEKAVTGIDEAAGEKFPKYFRGGQAVTFMYEDRYRKEPWWPRMANLKTESEDLQNDSEENV